MESAASMVLRELRNLNLSCSMGSLRLLCLFSTECGFKVTTGAEISNKKSRTLYTVECFRSLNMARRPASFSADSPRCHQLGWLVLTHCS